MTATGATATANRRPTDKSLAPPALAKRQGPSGFSRRYRDIIIAVTLFIVIDLGVLVLNFYTSFQIGEDALGVNLAGRQRMLSQRMTKAVLTLDIEQSAMGAMAPPLWTSCARRWPCSTPASKAFKTVARFLAVTASPCTSRPPKAHLRPKRWKMPA
jgi:hypothetical protein